jgi:hypothetical protein
MRIQMSHEQYHRVIRRLEAKRLLSIIQNTENGYSSVSGGYVILVIKSEYAETVRKFANRLNK